MEPEGALLGYGCKSLRHLACDSAIKVCQTKYGNSLFRVIVQICAVPDVVSVISNIQCPPTRLTCKPRRTVALEWHGYLAQRLGCQNFATDSTSSDEPERSTRSNPECIFPTRSE